MQNGNRALATSIVFLVVAMAPLGSLCAEQSQWVVVTPPKLRNALEPLVEARAKQGFRVTVLETVGDDASAGTAPVEDLRERIGAKCSAFDGKSCVLLVGDWDERDVNVHLPVHLGRHGRMAGKLTDHGFGQPDKDTAATVAVGRFPARSASEAAAMVRKTLRFEQQPYGPWTNRLVLLAGNPGGRSLFEKRFAELVVQNTAGKRLVDLHPRWQTTCVVDLPGTPFSVAPGQFGQAALDVLESGQLFAFYVGHSGAGGMWSNQGFVLLASDFAELKIANSPGVFVTSGCYACQVRGPGGQGFAVAAFRNPDGPAAVIGSFGESYAALGQLALEGIVHRLNEDRPPQRLGDYWLAAQAGMARGTMDPITFWLYDQADGSRGQVPLAQQRLEHLEMWTLLGDPAMRIPILRSSFDVQVSGNLAPGGTLRVSADVGVPLERARATITAFSRYIPAAVGSAGEATDERRPPHPTYGSTVGETKAVVADGVVRGEISLPPELPDQHLVVRVIVANQREPMMGVRMVQIRRPPVD